jgi:DeoR family deoxyribose operon repressor
VMLGGLYHAASASFSGDHNLETLDNFGINVAFISAAGVDAGRGVTCAHFHEGIIKRKVIALARENYLVVDSSKIGKLQRAHFAPMSAFKAMITEHGETAIAEQ